MKIFKYSLVVFLFIIGWHNSIAQDEIEREFWSSVNCDRELEVRAYLETYPGGIFIDQALECIRQQGQKKENIPEGKPRIIVTTDLNSEIAQSITNIIHNNLILTGLFDVLPMEYSEATLNTYESRGIAFLISIKADKLDTNINARLINIKTKKQIFGLRYNLKPKQSTVLAHSISNEIYQNLVGDEGEFLKKIAYVSLDTSGQYSIMISFFDGFNPKTILHSPKRLQLLKWSEDRKQIAYYSWEQGRKTLFIQRLSTAERATYKGVENAPAWINAEQVSQDNKRMSIEITKDENHFVYLGNEIVTARIRNSNGELLQILW